MQICSVEVFFELLKTNHSFCFLKSFIEPLKVIFVEFSFFLYENIGIELWSHSLLVSGIVVFKNSIFYSKIDVSKYWI